MLFRSTLNVRIVGQPAVKIAQMAGFTVPAGTRALVAFADGVGMDFPLHVDAEIYLKDGPSFLHRHLPFWTAVWVGRFVKIVIPLLVILIPLFTYIPSAKNFLLRLKLAQVYAELRALEKNALNPELKNKNRLDLEDIERRVNNIKVSMMDSKELYDLKSHVGDVRARLSHLYT